jgi:hypothetical protein
MEFVVGSRRRAPISDAGSNRAERESMHAKAQRIAASRISRRNVPDKRAPTSSRLASLKVYTVITD